MLKETILDLPFLPPDAGKFVDLPEDEFVGPGRGIGTFNAEYAMIDSESRLRRALEGEMVDPSNRFLSVSTINSSENI